jgi:hypothetical protein
LVFFSSLKVLSFLTFARKVPDGEIPRWEEIKGFFLWERLRFGPIDSPFFAPLRGSFSPSQRKTVRQFGYSPIDRRGTKQKQDAFAS